MPHARRPTHDGRSAIPTDDLHAPAGAAGHAVVVGAGIAGLTVASALTHAFDHVTVLDRDDLPAEADHRRGVPQDRHLHLLLSSGAETLDDLFPGLLDELLADGANDGDLSQIRMCLNGHRLATRPLGRREIFASRPFVEAHVRRRVRAEPAITLRGGVAVRGLATTDDGHRVVGVRAAGDGAHGGDEPEVLRADLVVDCSGRRSQTPRWLTGLGFEAPSADELPVEVRYTTRPYGLPAGTLDDDRHVLVGPTPDGPRGAAMTNAEHDRWIVTLFGMGGERPPTDLDAFEAYAATLPIPDVADALRAGRPLEEAAEYRFPANLRRRYDRLGRFPEGLLVAGDAVCSFNPIYGQGMSVSAVEATLLRELLRGGAVPSAPTWFDAITGIVEQAWDLAVGGDLAVRCVQGRRSVSTRMTNRYLRRLHAAAARDPVLTERFGRVISLLDPPTRLLRPSAMARVARGAVRGPAHRP